MTSFDVPNISFGGLATGLDTNAIISALLAVEQVPIDMMIQNKGVYQSKISAFDTFKSHLDALQSAADDLKEDTDFKVFSVTSNMEDVVTGTASKYAIAGNYTIDVTSLATYDQWASDGLSSSDVSVGSGTLSITVAGVQTDITIDPGEDTLTEVATAINASDAEVTASVINTGDPGGNPYKLVITGKDTGVTNTVTIDTSGLSGGTEALVFIDDQDHHIQTASNAEFTINGIDMQRETNDITDAMPGLSFTLTGTTEVGSPATLTVEVDQDKIVGKIKSFVDAYNEVVNFVNKHNTFDETMESGGLLMGESMLTMVLGKLQSKLTPEWEAGGDEVQILAQIGIEFENDGTLKLTESDLKSGIADHFDDVVDMFTEDGFGDQIDAYLEEYTKFAGLIDSKKDSFESIIKDLDEQIVKAEYQLDEYEASLVKKFAALESLMSGLQAQQAYLSSVQYPG